MLRYNPIWKDVTDDPRVTAMLEQKGA
jgi:hypothetical protein